MFYFRFTWRTCRRLTVIGCTNLFWEEPRSIRQDQVSWSLKRNIRLLIKYFRFPWRSSSQSKFCWWNCVTCWLVHVAFYSSSFRWDLQTLLLFNCHLFHTLLQASQLWSKDTGNKGLKTTSTIPWWSNKSWTYATLPRDQLTWFLNWRLNQIVSKFKTNL